MTSVGNNGSASINVAGPENIFLELLKLVIAPILNTGELRRFSHFTILNDVRIPLVGDNIAI
jgi:hypothetical protein